jgi:hypothetical protein
MNPRRPGGTRTPLDRAGGLGRSWLRDAGVRFEGRRAVARIRQDGAALERGGRRRAHPGAGGPWWSGAALGSAPLLDHAVQLHPVRGQVSWGPHGEDAGALPPFPVNGNGHFLPRVPLLERGAWITGSTYGRGDTDTRCAAATTPRTCDAWPRCCRGRRAVEGAAAARGQLAAGAACAAPPATGGRWRASWRRACGQHRDGLARADLRRPCAGS